MKRQDKILKSENCNDQDISKSIINIDNNNSENENILRNIYMKSNSKIAEKLMKINDKLDFGKEEEEFNLIEEKEKTEIKDLNPNIEINDNKSQSKIYFLSCLVKTSHHIKGVCFIDQSKLNFKIFLNQQTGKSMNGINMSFTDTDEDYDPERKTCYGSYFMFHHKDKNLYKISIKYSDIKTTIAVGIIMGISATIFLFTSGHSIELSNMMHYIKSAIKYLPISACYILSMFIGYKGLKYIELTISSPVQNTSGVITSLLLILFFREVLPYQAYIAFILIFVGIFGVFLLEKKDKKIVKLSKKTKLLAIVFPLIYCLIDGLGTFLDSVYIDKLEIISEDLALVC